METQTRKPISRTFYVHETNKKNGGMNRIVTVCYTYDFTTKTLMYGASIYKCENNDTSHFSRKTHRETAMQRLQKKPVILNDVEYGKVFDFHKSIRKQMYTNGVASKSN